MPVLIHDTFRERPAFAATAKITKLESNHDIQLNRIFDADFICLLHPDVSSVAKLHLLFPGKTSPRDHDYDVHDDVGNFHIVLIKTQKPIAAILDVDRAVVDIEDETDVCSRNLTVRLQKTGNKRTIKVATP